MKCSVFIATSADGYIATLDDGVDWLHASGKTDIDLGDRSDMGFNDFIASVDCMVMGRKCMEKLSSFNLSAEQWPYRDIPIFVLSKTLDKPSNNLFGSIKMFSDDIPALISQLERDGLSHAYVDGGATITSFINLQLINEMTITQAPILLGAGKPLFGHIDSQIKLVNVEAVTYPNDFVQIKYHVISSSDELCSRQ
jgi:dihydrofolate reductase